MFDTVHRHLRITLDSRSPSESVATAARAVGSLLSALDCGDSKSRAFVWKAIPDFCEGMRYEKSFSEKQGMPALQW
jgi:hypothetical protein